MSRTLSRGDSSRGTLTNEIHDAVRDAQGARRLDAAAQLDDLGLELARGVPRVAVGGLAVLLQLEAGEVLLGEVDEAGADVLADQVPAVGVGALDGDLDLQLAAAEAEVHDGLAAAGLAVGRADLAGHAAGPGGAPVAGLVLLHLVVARDAQVDLALADKGRDVGRGEEDERDGQVLDEGDVEPVLPAELDVGALEQVKRRLLQPALLSEGRVALAGAVCLRGLGGGGGSRGRKRTLGDGEEQPAF